MHSLAVTIYVGFAGVSLLFYVIGIVLRRIERKIDLVLIGQHGSLTAEERAAVQAATEKIRASSAELKKAVDEAPK